MSIVIIEQDGIRRGSVLNHRTVIGRWESNGIIIDDPSVSRVHAWISRRDDGCYITDAQSRTGTRVNGQEIEARRQLSDGDQIQIGPCRLIFHDAATLPDGIDAIRRPGSSDTGFPGKGILFNCACGAPLWAPAKMTGTLRRCHYCRSPIIIPPRSGMTAESAAVDTETTVDGAACSICQWRIDPSHDTATCPECGLTFHAECWTENQGCSSYGCSQVNVLSDKDEGGRMEDESNVHPYDRSWESGLLGASVAASVVGMLAFGVPALIVAGAAGVLIVRRRGRTAPLAIASAVSLIGLGAGIAASYWWWL